MLVLSRSRGQTIIIGDDIEISVVDIRGDKVRLGITAPRSVSVHRKEVYDSIHDQNLASANLTPGDIPVNPPRPVPVSLGPVLKSPATSSLFTTWKDPVSGIESYLLTERVAALQQSMRSGSSCSSGDGRFLWFFVGFPPAGDVLHGRMLAVIDFAEQDVRYYPETQFAYSSPLVDATTGEIFWVTGCDVYKRGPKRYDKPFLVNRLAADLAAEVRAAGMAAELSLSCDGKLLAFDVAAEGRRQIVAIPTDGSPAEVWHTSEGASRAARFSPADAGLMLVADAEGRPCLLRRGEPLRVLSAVAADGWWSGDGEYVYIAAEGSGTQLVRVSDGARETLWARCASHGAAAGDYFIAEGAGSSIVFFNTRTRKEVVVVSEMPAPPGLTQAYRPSTHPRLCLNDRYFGYTTTVLGRVDVAMVSTERLVAATS
jgi:carbon storage regulator CsrA